MDKLTFLEELKKSLRVLKEEELQDIIGEYEQHIDMKVEKGLTVEQAIADFGNVHELAAEILEAYHVRAEYSMSGEMKSPEERKIESENTSEKINEEKEEHESVQEKRGILSTGLEGLRSIHKKICSCISPIFRWFMNGCLWLLKQSKRPYLWIKEKISGMRALRKSKKEEIMNRGNSIIANDLTDGGFQKDSAELHTDKWFVKMIKGMGRMVQIVWNWMIGAALWCLRVCWNCCVIGTTVMIGSFGLMCLFAAGVLGVLWMQGYPFAGLTIGCLGLVFSLFAGTALIWTLMWNRSKKEDTETQTADLEIVEAEEGQHA